jgi:hypothetical protein
MSKVPFITALCALPALSLEPLPVWSKSVTNEVHFTFYANTVSRPYLSSHCTEVTEILNVVLSSHELQVMHVSSISVSNEGHFTLETKALFPLTTSPRIAAG